MRTSRGGLFPVVRDLMTPDPLTRSSRTSVEELIGVMCERDVRHVPIVDGGKLVGIVSSKDTGRRGAAARDVMTRRPWTIRPDEKLEVAAAIMAVRKISALLVVDRSNRLLGILTTYDVLDAFARGLRARRKDAGVTHQAAARPERRARSAEAAGKRPARKPSGCSRRPR